MYHNSVAGERFYGTPMNYFNSHALQVIWVSVVAIVVLLAGIIGAIEDGAKKIERRLMDLHRVSLDRNAQHVEAIERRLDRIVSKLES